MAWMISASCLASASAVCSCTMPRKSGTSTDMEKEKGLAHEGPIGVSNAFLSSGHASRPSGRPASRNARSSGDPQQKGRPGVSQMCCRNASQAAASRPSASSSLNSSSTTPSPPASTPKAPTSVWRLRSTPSVALIWPCRLALRNSMSKRVSAAVEQRLPPCREGGTTFGSSRDHARNSASDMVSSLKGSRPKCSASTTRRWSSVSARRSSGAKSDESGSRGTAAAVVRARHSEPREQREAPRRRRRQTICTPLAGRRLPPRRPTRCR
mmetsp:Transcript_24539/g.80000  ORF Transcript_24539/g.80000 Transcript_24539/m.80000 type:complete len:268 (-) Transcript_24539:796-1599(-)